MSKKREQMIASKSLGLVIRLVFGGAFVVSLVYSIMHWVQRDIIGGVLILIMGVVVFFIGGIILWALQKIHKKGVYTYDAWEKDVT